MYTHGALKRRRKKHVSIHSVTLRDREINYNLHTDKYRLVLGSNSSAILYQLEFFLLLLFFSLLCFCCYWCFDLQGRGKKNATTNSLSHRSQYLVGCCMCFLLLFDLSVCIEPRVSSKRNVYLFIEDRLTWLILYANGQFTNKHSGCQPSALLAFQ